MRSPVPLSAVVLVTFFGSLLLPVRGEALSFGLMTIGASVHTGPAMPNHIGGKLGLSLTDGLYLGATFHYIAAQVYNDYGPRYALRGSGHSAVWETEGSGGVSLGGSVGYDFLRFKSDSSDSLLLVMLRVEAGLMSGIWNTTFRPYDDQSENREQRIKVQNTAARVALPIHLQFEFFYVDVAPVLLVGIDTIGSAGDSIISPALDASFGVAF